jgi:hypothetical protein
MTALIFFWFAYVEKKVNSANSVADSANNFWFYRRQRETVQNDDFQA